MPGQAIRAKGCDLAQDEAAMTGALALADYPDAMVRVACRRRDPRGHDALPPRGRADRVTNGEPAAVAQ